MKQNTVKRIFSNNWFMIKYAFITVPFYTLMVCFFGSIHAVIMYFEHTYMIKYVVDCIQYDRPFIYAFYYILTIFIAVTLWLLINNFYNSKFKRKHQEKLNKKLQFEIYTKATIMDLSSYDDPEYYNDFIWAMSESNSRIDAVLDSLNMLSRNTTTLITCGAFIISYDIIGLIFVAFAFVCTYLINTKVNKLQYKLNIELQPRQRKRDYINRVLYLNDYAKEIRLSEVKYKLYKDYDTENDQLISIIKKHSKKLTFLTFISDFVFNSLIFNGVYIIYLLFRTIVLKAISYGTMATLIQSSTRLKEAINGLTNTLPRFQENSLYIEKLRKFLSYQPKIISNIDALVLSNTSLSLNNIQFAYSGKTEPILKGINFSIKPKEKIAIVGHNGAGKTTLINLILRLYDVTNGEILYNDVNIRDYKPLNYRNKFGVVFQDYQLFATTIAENVVMDVTDTTNYEDIVEALKTSGFEEKLISLENGINTTLTKEFDENGTELSGGESQKIAISRALYKDSEIIILDEPSSALDPISEYYLNQTIFEIAKDKTIVFISHRLSTTKMADKIFLIGDGKIIEHGTHTDLMALKGKYAHMFNLQAERYRLKS